MYQQNFQTLDSTLNLCISRILKDNLMNLSEVFQTLFDSTLSKKKMLITLQYHRKNRDEFDRGRK